MWGKQIGGAIPELFVRGKNNLQSTSPLPLIQPLTMALSQAKRKLEEGMRGKISRPKKRMRQQEYHSSSDSDSDDGFAPVNLDDTDEDVDSSQKKAGSEKAEKAVKEASEMSTSDESDAGSERSTSDDVTDDDLGSLASRKRVSKRNDPEAFSTSIAKILSTKLSRSARQDPVLSRSREAAEASSTIANERLETKAREKLRAERKEDLERGRVKDVLGLRSGQAGEVAEEEKRLRKIAQRGVVKLFNAVRAAQVRAEQVAREERQRGTVGMANRQEKVSTLSKQSFLDLITGKNKNGEEVEAT